MHGLLVCTQCRQAYARCGTNLTPRNPQPCAPQLTGCCTCSVTDWHSKASASPNRAPRLTGQQAHTAATTSGWRQHQPQPAPRRAAQRDSRQLTPASPIRAHGHPQGQGRERHCDGQPNAWTPAPSKSRAGGGPGRAPPATSGSSPRNQHARPTPHGALPPRTPGPEHAPHKHTVLRHYRLAHHVPAPA